MRQRNKLSRLALAIWLFHPSLAVAQIPLTPATPTGSIAEALSHSSFVFTAQVVSRGGTTTRQVPESPTNLVVRIRRGIDSVLTKPRGFINLVGRSLTIVAPDSSPVQSGASVLVLASFLAADTGIALKANAIALIDSSSLAPVLLRLDAGRDSLRQARLAFAIDHATIVALVTVDSLGPVTSPAALGGLSGDTQFWQRAVMRVERTFKPAGDKSTSRLVALVPVQERVGDAVFPVSVGARLLALFRTTPPGPRLRATVAVRIEAYLADGTDVLPIADSLRVKRAGYP